MGLFERITAQDDTKIVVHRLGAALREVARGNLTQAQVITALSLDASDQTQLGEIITTYSALGTDKARMEFQTLFEDAGLLVESGDYNKATYNARLGIT